MLRRRVYQAGPHMVTQLNCSTQDPLNIKVIAHLQSANTLYKLDRLFFLSSTILRSKLSKHYIKEFESKSYETLSINNNNGI